MAFEAGLDRTYISILEMGKRSPTLDTLMVLCAAFDIQLDHIATKTLSELKGMNTEHDTQGST